MKEYILAKIYADAIYSLLEKKDVYEFLKFLKIFNERLSDIQEILNNPNISIIEKRKVIEKISNNNNYSNILEYMLEKQRIDILPYTYEKLVKKYNDDHNILVVDAYFPVEITDTQKEKLTNILNKKYNKTIKLYTHIDKNLIGGGIIKINDLIIDGSYAKQLKDISKGGVHEN